MRLIPFLVFITSLAVGGSAAAQSPTSFGADKEHVETELVSATDAIVPGQPLQVAVRMKHDPHWHTYWQVPGDSGLPTQINWKLPAGFIAGAIEWPHPQRLPTGPLMNFGYEGEVLLLTHIQVPQNLAVGSNAVLAARVDWLECSDVCIPGNADLKLSLPVKASAGSSMWSPMFSLMQARVPQVLAGLSATGTLDQTRIRVDLKLPPDHSIKTLEFFPLEESRIEPAAAQTLRSDASGNALLLTAAQPVKKDFSQLRGVLVANGGPNERGGWAAMIDAPLQAGLVSAGPAPQAGAASPVPMDAISLLAALGFAFLGGLILNLMPCVFPVLSLKLIGLAQHREHRGPLSSHGVAFTVGVVLSFVLLAGLLIGLQHAGSALGWGFQLQTPWVVAALTLLFFTIGLNLLGVYEVSFGGSVANLEAADTLARKSDWRGSFGTGVLAVIVASPCTAPFMASALGYAVTQPAPIALTVFAAMGLGMAVPYLLLTLYPQWLSKLPRPGAWMEHFKQFMAFPMFATCVWLLWVLAQQVDSGSVAMVLITAVLTAFTLWAWGLAQRGARFFRWAAMAGALLAAFAFAPVTTSGAATSNAKSADARWLEYSPERLAELRNNGKPVFVDFTAAWCVSCQVNNRLAIETDKVRHQVDVSGITLMKADWTNRDERITKALAQFGRNGVPLYVLYDRKGEATVLPELLTEGTVINAFQKIN